MDYACWKSILSRFLQKTSIFSQNKIDCFLITANWNLSSKNFLAYSRGACMFSRIFTNWLKSMYSKFIFGNFFLKYVIKKVLPVFSFSWTNNNCWFWLTKSLNFYKESEFNNSKIFIINNFFYFSSGFECFLTILFNLKSVFSG